MPELVLQVAKPRSEVEDIRNYYLVDISLRNFTSRV